MTLSVFSWNEIRGEPEAGRQLPDPVGRRGPPWACSFPGCRVSALGSRSKATPACLRPVGRQTPGRTAWDWLADRGSPEFNFYSGWKSHPASLLGMMGPLAWAHAHPGSRPPWDPCHTPPLRTLCHGHSCPPPRGPTLLGAWSTRCLRLDRGQRGGPRAQAISSSPPCFSAIQAAAGGLTQEQGPHSLRLGGPPGAHSPADLKPPAPPEPPRDTTARKDPTEAHGANEKAAALLPDGGSRGPPTGGSNNGHSQPARHTVTFGRLPCLPPGRPREPWDRLYGS